MAITAMNFPTPAASGDVYTANNGITYTYDGTKWIGQIGSSGSTGNLSIVGTTVYVQNVGEEITLQPDGSGNVYIGSPGQTNNLVLSNAVVFPDGTSMTTAASGGGGGPTDRLTAGSQNVILDTDGNLAISGNIKQNDSRLSLNENGAGVVYLTTVTDDATALYIDQTSAYLYAQRVELAGGNLGVGIFAGNTWINMDDSANGIANKIQFLVGRNNIAGPTRTWTIESDASLIPGDDNLQDIGTPTKRVRHIYVGPGSVTVGNAVISESSTGSLVIPGLTRATGYTAEEVEDAGDQTQTFTPNSEVVVVDAALYAAILASTDTSYFADYTATTDNEGYINNIQVNGQGSYSQADADVAKGNMYAYVGAGSASDRPIVPQDWVQIPFRLRLRAGGTEYEFPTNPFDQDLNTTDTVTFAGVTVGANASITNDSNEFRVWATDTDITVYRNGRDGYGVKDNSVEVFANNNKITKITDAGFEIVQGYLKFSDGTTQTSASTGGGSGDRLTNGNYSVVLSSDGILTLPTDASEITAVGYIQVKFNTDGVIGGIYADEYNTQIDSPGTIIIKANNGADMFGPPAPQWDFGTDGVLTLPADIGDIKRNGVSVLGAGSYTLPTASDTVLGGVKIGSGLSIDGNGIVSVSQSTGVTISDVAPTLDNGQLWFNSEEARTYIRYNEQWVDANPTVLPLPVDPSRLVNGDAELALDENGSIVVGKVGANASITILGGGAAVVLEYPSMLDIVQDNSSPWALTVRNADAGLDKGLALYIDNEGNTSFSVYDNDGNDNSFEFNKDGYLRLNNNAQNSKLIVGTINDGDTVVWADDADAEYLGLWYGGNYQGNGGYGPRVSVNVGNVIDDGDYTPEHQDQNPNTEVVNVNVAGSNWNFRLDGGLTLPHGGMISDGTGGGGTSVFVSSHPMRYYAFDTDYFETGNGTVTTGNARYFTCDVLVTPDGEYIITNYNPGNSWVVGHVLTIDGEDLEGSTPDNDLTITITGVGTEGVITSISVSGRGTGRTIEFAPDGNINNAVIDGGNASTWLLPV